MKYSRLSALLLSTFAIFCSTNLTAIDIDSQVNLSSGYSNDIISAHNTIKTPTGNQTVDKFRIDNLNIGKVGINFLFTPFKKEGCSHDLYFANTYLKGYAYWGWSGVDNFERITKAETANDTTVATFISQGRQKARTQDYQIGLGYLVYNCNDLALGLTGGYSYDSQRIRTSSGKTSINNEAFSHDQLYRGLVFKQKWEGAWVGGDLFYNSCDWLVNVGYEYHFTNYYAHFNIPNNPAAQASDFSDVRKGHNADGNVAYISAHRTICGDINAGLAFAYKHFRVDHSHMKPRSATFAEEGYPEGTVGRATSKWINYSIIADLGYSF